jgi:hypothetical protein
VKGAIPLLIILVASACREETITRARVPKDAPRAAAPMAAMPPASGAAGPGGGEFATASRAGGPRWTLPKGWTEKAGTGMRAATLIPPGGGKAEVTVIALPGDSGGELANANRWRGQIGLGPVDEAGLAKTRTRLSAKAGRVDLYDFTSADGKTRLAAGVLVLDGTSWFFKLVGEASAVADALPRFKTLLESLDAP